MAARTQTGKKAIRAIFATAQRQIEDEKPPHDPNPNEPRDGYRPGQWPGAPHDALPPNCPVHVVGRDTEGTVWCVTATGHMRAVEKWDMPTLVDLFAPQVNFLYWAWPAFGKKKTADEDGGTKEELRVMRVEKDKVATCLINQAAKRPDFAPASQHRGRGGWKDKTGRFIWHSGGWLWTSEKGRLEKTRPAEHEGFLYTRQPPTIEPWDEPVNHDETPARRILEDLRTWKWERPYLDPALCLGWLATSLMGGALKTRPVIFTTGGAGVGKTTMRELFRNVLDGAVFAVADTTAAGIYQKLKSDSLMVMVDELESKPGSSRAQSVIDLARIAYSGDDMARGGQDHHGVTFKMHASFFFSAINPPPMTEADKSRMAILNLERLNAAEGIGRKSTVVIDADGRMLLRQVMDGWTDFNGRLLQNWWDCLQRQKLDARAIDTFGTLLAAAELLVGPQGLEDIGLPIDDETRLGEMIAAATKLERAERLDNWHKCLNRLLDSTIEAWRDGVKPTIGSVIEAVGSGKAYPKGLELTDAQERLQLVNCSLRKPGDPGEGPCLAIPSDGPALLRIFADTPYAAGGWYGALKQAPKDIVRREDGNRQKMKINGVTRHCLLVDMKKFADYVDRETP